ncbi:MAG TPA: DNA internalization-related competence protein ComEC/Rec2 [Thermoanaerobaculia bacterium]|nr:DNA internalization-related competence protein ComEC/Rec2 [Thermoanaerobaculia bacterium]
MRHEVPAAYPLIGLIAGLAVGPVLVNPVAFAIGVALIAIARPRLAATIVFVIAGIVLSIRVAHRALPFVDADVFTIVEAPLERDWAPRENAFVLRASHFRANGVDYDEPVAIYVRSRPRQIAMEQTIRVEGFLRVSERGEYTVSVKSPLLMSYAGTLRWWQPAAWNRALENRIEREADAHRDEVALAEALVLGRGERLSREMRDSFRRGGTYHLLVFSGLQIAFAAGILAALLRWLHRPRASDWLLLVFALLAPPFIGPTASVARASSGIGLYAFSRILKRPTSIENLWCVAALLRLLLEPRDLGDAAFHLTYAGAAALLFIGKHFRKWIGHVIAAEIVITPLTLHHFHQYALGGSLLTLLISPLIFAMLIVSSLLIAMPCEPLFAMLRALHRACVFANAYGLSGVFASPPLASLIVAAALSLLALAALREKPRAIAIALAMLIPSAAAVMKHVEARYVEAPRVTFLDVGQGDAIAIRSGTHTILVDGGRDDRILALLADRGVRRIDTIVLTHAHPDHCGGLASVIERFDVGSVWLSPRRFRGDCASLMLEACATTRTPIHLARDGDHLTLDNITIDALITDRTFRRAAENNASIVLRVTAGGRRFLLTGDIEREAELDFADRDLRVDVLKVPHHGSRTSTSQTLLDHVAPRFAVISCGRRNLFGHPHADVLGALGERRIRTWRTDRDGSIDVDIRGGKLYVRARLD